MVGNNYLSSFNHIYPHHLPLLTLCGKRVKQSQTVRSGRFESNLLTWPGRPKHTHGNRVPTQHFSFLSGSWIRVTILDYRVRRLYTRACMRTSSKRVREKSTLRSDQVLKLTDYHISRHVVSTFKCLTDVPHTAALVHFH